MWFEKGINSPVSDYSDIQQIAIDSARDGDTLVEVGAFVGESIHSLIDKKIQSRKDLKIFAVDSFCIKKMCEDGNHSLDMEMNSDKLTPNQWLSKYGDKCMLVEFYKYLNLAKKENHLDGVLCGESVKISDLFANNSIHYCYIDAGHSYESVYYDLESWYPKIRKNGIFSGHDWFSSEEIRAAVIDFSKSHNLNIYTTQSSWVLRPIE